MLGSLGAEFWQCRQRTPPDSSTIEHCDGLGVGEAEAIWRMMLEDAVHGRLSSLYRADSLSSLPMPLTQAGIASWVINFSQRRMARAGQGHNDFDSVTIQVGRAVLCPPPAWPRRTARTE